ncbi:hypothetical protein SAMN05421676_11237 [Salinibacillus kushneri]|uniref:Uncharacterized protein n=1 Tax=Salinibacillus kushneri TaxID=237682 RepID=A0A1I0IGI7_9BACI|nr:hypothetical protein [Salinibacillus kushneri]SET95203.1 hypothetical protein SAMN05421676_11237 [Salinibacillus kushneri]
MSEWLSTGEMIDRLKVGEVAEAEEGYTVIRNNNGSITYLNKEPKYGQYLAINLTTHRLKWRILPNYVSFSDAMKAVEEGKNAYCEFQDETIKFESYNNKLGSICKDNACTAGGGAEIKLAWINAGKWTIEEEAE